MTHPPQQPPSDFLARLESHRLWNRLRQVAQDPKVSVRVERHLAQLEDKMRAAIATHVGAPDTASRPGRVEGNEAAEIDSFRRLARVQLHDVIELLRGEDRISLDALSSLQRELRALQRESEAATSPTSHAQEAESLAIDHARRYSRSLVSLMTAQRHDHATLAFLLGVVERATELYARLLEEVRG